MTRTDIRLALPSKGILQEGAIELLEACGMKIQRSNPRQYEARIPALGGITVMFQRPSDIVVSVRQGSIDFGITGLDVLREQENENGSARATLMLHDELGFAPCSLNLAVPEASPVRSLSELRKWAEELAADGRTLRIATKFPNLTSGFLDREGIKPYKLIKVEGTLEIAPVIGFADMISDLVSSGITLRDNHLTPLRDGKILSSQACLIANREAVTSRPEVLAIARQLLEFIEANFRAEGSYLVIANMRGGSPEEITAKMAPMPHIGGLQGPTVSPVYPQGEAKGGWWAVNIVCRKADLFQSIAELRSIGGSGVIVAPLTYIFEEEPARYQTLLRAIGRFN